MSVGEPDDEWEEYNFSGYVPLILAGYRMSAARRTFAGLEKLIQSITADVESQAADFLAWSRAHEHDEYPGEPEFFIDMAAQEGYAAEMLGAADELPKLFFGGLIVYLLSTLEATLADCLEEIQIASQGPTVKKVPNPKLENLIEALESCGVRLGLDDEIWSRLRAWRKVRNNFVHSLETLRGEPDLSNSAAQEVYWLADAVLRKLDEALSNL
jgi:hypothetical protein